MAEDRDQFVGKRELQVIAVVTSVDVREGQDCDCCLPRRRDLRRGSELPHEDSGNEDHHRYRDPRRRGATSPRRSGRTAVPQALEVRANVGRDCSEAAVPTSAFMMIGAAGAGTGGFYGDAVKDDRGGQPEKPSCGRQFVSGAERKARNLRSPRACSGDSTRWCRRLCCCR